MFLLEYINWYYNASFKKLLLISSNLIIFFFHYFNIPFHLKTLMYPWKRQAIAIRRDFFFQDVASVITFNLISQSIGLTIRSMTIISGFIVILMLGIIAVFTISIFILTPFLYFPLYILSQRKKKSEAVKLLTSYKDIKSLLINTLKKREGQFILQRLGISHEALNKFFLSIYTPGDITLFLQKLKERKDNIENITIGEILAILYSVYPPFSNILKYHEIKPDDLIEVANWYDKLNTKEPHINLLNLESLLRIPFIGKDWANGYTPRLNKLADITKSKNVLYPRLIGRNKEIKELERLLSTHTQNSVIVVGEPGVGRHATVWNFSKSIENGWGLPPLANKRILYIDLKSLIKENSSPLELKKEISDILKEGSDAGNIILVIDSIDIFVSEGEGRMNLTDVLSGSLSEGKLQIIGITDPASYHKYIQPNVSLTQVFDKLEIEPPALSVVLESLELSIVPILEYKYDITITIQALKEIINDAGRYVSTHPFPEKAIDMLDEVIVFVTLEKKETIITPHHVQEFLSRKTKIPIGQIQKLEKEKLAHLEELMHQKIISQNDAISGIARGLRRARTNVSGEGKPIGSFLFLGPTGVGKTETAKVLAQIYFGSEEKMIRFDMSQYQKDEGMNRLIGSGVSGQTGELTQKIIDHPFSLILLDELEKADKKVYNLLLTLIEEGYIVDSLGRKIDARNNIFIATSNAGSEYIRELVLKGTTHDTLKKEVLNYIQKKHIFSPEFLNRFDEVIVFKPLSEGELREVTKLLLQKLNKQIGKQGLQLDINDQLIQKLTTIGFDPVFGARAIKRTIAEKIEDQIAQKILNEEVKRGEKISIQI